MLTVSEDEGDLAAALRAGACGYLLKTIEGDALAAAIHRVMRGESVVADEMTGKLVSAFQSIHGQAAPATLPEPDAPADPLASLSPREQQILREISRGASNKEIARTLDIAETTVKIHVQHILRKLNLSSRVQAAVLASGQWRV
jgi:two-component system nitrate/nitrite response regulator NarL